MGRQDLVGGQITDDASHHGRLRFGRLHARLDGRIGTATPAGTKDKTALVCHETADCVGDRVDWADDALMRAACQACVRVWASKFNPCRWVVQVKALSAPRDGKANCRCHVIRGGSTAAAYTMLKPSGLRLLAETRLRCNQTTVPCGASLAVPDGCDSDLPPVRIPSGSAGTREDVGRNQKRDKASTAGLSQDGEGNADGREDAQSSRDVAMACSRV